MLQVSPLSENWHLNCDASVTGISSLFVQLQKGMHIKIIKQMLIAVFNKFLDFIIISLSLRGCKIIWSI